MRAYYFFGVRSSFGLVCFDACCLFPRGIQAIIPLIIGTKLYGLPVLPGRWGQWAAPACGNSLMGPLQCRGHMRRWVRQTAPGFRALGSGNDPQGDGGKAHPFQGCEVRVHPWH